MKTTASVGASLLLLVLGSIQALVGQTPSPGQTSSSKSSQQVDELSRSRSVRSSKRARNSNNRRPHPDFALPPPAATFLSATQIESIGGAIYPVVSGNFNGDALPDIVTLFQDTGSPTGTYLAVLLNVSNGSFSRPLDSRHIRDGKFHSGCVCKQRRER